jgi:hypothetical protein
MSKGTEMRPWLACFCLTIVQVLGGACSNKDDSDPGRGGSGGQGSGGTSATGGSVNPSGGMTASGGTTSSGGVISTGGTSASGGTIGAGGTAESGGTTSSGGEIGSGGRTVPGGATGRGGVMGSGGATSKGGAMGSGGATGKGGATGSGGQTSTGTCPTEAETKFSFFLTSYAGLQLDSKTTDGYGGDLGGLAGADAICQRIAERSSACQKNKTWRAFLSTPTVNARDRIGKGPWYDRLGRLLAANMENLLTERPTGADPAIVNDFPNENGIPNHNPDQTGLVDNHEILTGTGVDGKVYTQSTTGGGTGGMGGGFPGGFPMGTDCGPSGEAWSVEKATCWGWTNKEPKGCPRVGHSWPRQGSGIGWISVWNEAGCFPGGTLLESGFDTSKRNVGSNGGYGGFYCFAVTGL